MSPEGNLPILSCPNVGEHHQHPADEDDRSQPPRDRILPIDIFHPIFPNTASIAITLPHAGENMIVLCPECGLG